MNTIHTDIKDEFQRDLTTVWIVPLKNKTDGKCYIYKTWHKLLKKYWSQTKKMFQNVAYRSTVYITGLYSLEDEFQRDFKTAKTELSN